jgi:hypothetical protein
MDFKQKYLKYKEKYLNLKNIFVKGAGNSNSSDKRGAAEKAAAEKAAAEKLVAKVIKDAREAAAREAAAREAASREAAARKAASREAAAREAAAREAIAREAEEEEEATALIAAREAPAIEAAAKEAAEAGARVAAAEARVEEAEVAKAAAEAVPVLKELEAVLIVKEDELAKAALKGKVEEAEAALDKAVAVVAIKNALLKIALKEEAVAKVAVEKAIPAAVKEAAAVKKVAVLKELETALIARKDALKARIKAYVLVHMLRYKLSIGDRKISWKEFDEADSRAREGEGVKEAEAVVAVKKAAVDAALREAEALKEAEPAVPAALKEEAALKRLLAARARHEASEAYAAREAAIRAAVKANVEKVEAAREPEKFGRRALAEIAEFKGRPIDPVALSNFIDRIYKVNDLVPRTLRQDIRLEFTTNFSYAIPHSTTLTELASKLIGYKNILEVGAGSGLWAYLLCEIHHVPIRATDLFNGSYLFDNRYKYLPIERLDSVSAIVKYDPEVLMMVWAPLNSPMAYNCLKAFKGNLLVWIGELNGGCTASADFFNELEENWKMVDDIDMTSWRGNYDGCSIWHRQIPNPDKLLVGDS